MLSFFKKRKIAPFSEQKTKWPKKTAPFSDAEQKIADDWMQYTLKNHWCREGKVPLSCVGNFGHTFVVRETKTNFLRTLEIGSGMGEHLRHEALTRVQLENYTAIELREELSTALRAQWPTIQVVQADCQKKLPYSDGYFERIIAIHVLEHLPNLPACLVEIERLLQNDGRFFVVIPCEGGATWSLGRHFTSKRMFEKRYHREYEPFIRAEHVNSANEVLTELKKIFAIERTHWYPFLVPSIHINVCIGLILKKNEQ